jgi:hypothetical protein
MVKIQIIIDAEVKEEDMKASSPLMRILKIMNKQEDAQTKWYLNNRERILREEKQKRILFHRDQYEKRRLKKKEAIDEIIQHVEFPPMPADGILRFDNL